MVSKRQALHIGKRLRVDFAQINVEQFRKGITTEAQEHRDIIHNPVTAGKMALAHLKAVPDYYDQIERLSMEAIKC